VFQHLRDFTGCIEREKSAEGDISNPFMSKTEKKVLSYSKQESEKPGQQAVSRLPHPWPCVEMPPPACEDGAGSFSIFCPLAA